MDFEEALKDCEEICNALEVLVKPEILDTFISMIAEYRLNYSSNIDDLQAEIDDLNDRVAARDDIIDNLEHQILDLEGEVQEAWNSDKI